MPSEGARRSTRIPLEIEILLVGSDMEGKVFSEKTKTVVLSRYGAGIVSAYKLSPEQELIMRRLDTDVEAVVRVVGQIGAENNRYTYGMAFLDQSLDFWKINFPLMKDQERASLRVFLECLRCRARETVEQSDLESDVFLVNKGIVRYCKNCGSSTFWKRASEDVPVEVTVPQSPEQGAAEVATESAAAPVEAPPPAPAAPPPAPAPQPGGRPENRRKHVRTKASFQACVRTFAFGEDIVTCEDISRGGLRFRSRMKYSVNDTIQVAVPYTRGGANIFVPGQVVHVVELKDEKMFRCGVQYTEKRR